MNILTKYSIPSWGKQLINVMLAYLFILASVVTANFLMYTVANAEKDHIKLTHPKIIAEFVLSVAFVTTGLIMIY